MKLCLKYYWFVFFRTWCRCCKTSISYKTFTAKPISKVYNSLSSPLYQPAVSFQVLFFQHWWCQCGSENEKMTHLSSYFTRVADVTSRSRLRSSNSDQLIVPSFNIVTVGRRAFPVYAANLSNSLPAHLTLAPLLTMFLQRLKTFLFLGAPILT